MLTVAEINDIERLNEFRLLWQDLLGKTRDASFQQSIEWLNCYWQNFGHDQKLRVLIVSLAGRPVGIVPLMVKSMPSECGRVRLLTYPLDGWGVAFGPIGPNPTVTLLAAMRHIANTPRDWDLIDLRNVDLNTTDCRRTENALRSAGLQAYERPWQRTHRVALAAGWKSYWSTRSPQLRADYETSRRELQGLGQVTHVRYRPLGVMHGETNRRWDLLEDFEKLLSGQTSNPNADARISVATSQSARFLRDLHVTAVDAGSVDLNLLYLEDEPVAGSYNLHLQGRVEALHTAGTPEFGNDAERVLLQFMLRDGCDVGDQHYLFRDDCDDVAEWGTSVVTSCRYTHYARTAARAQLLRLNHCLTNWLSAPTGAVEPKPATAVATAAAAFTSASPMTASRGTTPPKRSPKPTLSIVR